MSSPVEFPDLPETDADGHEISPKKRRSIPFRITPIGAGIAALMVLVLLVGYLLGSAGDGGGVAAGAKAGAGSSYSGAPVTNQADESSAAVEQTPAVIAGVLTHVEPTSVQIPVIGVTSSLVELGLNSDGTLQVPDDFAKAGWYTGGPFPGDPGNAPPAVIVGHVDNYKGPAVFYRLKELKTGDTAIVTRADGTVATFVVYETHQFAKDDFPADQVYGYVPDTELRLITCTGTFDSIARSYLDNFVVYLKLDPSRSGMPS